MGRPGQQDRGLKEHPPGSGIWWVDIYHEGKRIRDKVGRKEDAQRRLLELRRQLKEGWKPFRPASLGALIHEYLPRLLETNERDRDVRRYAAEFQAEFGDLPAADLTVGDVDAWKQRRLARPSAPATVNRALAVLRRILELARRDRRLYGNVAMEAGPLPGAVRRSRRLSAEERERLRTELGAHWPIVDFALETGMRQGLQFGLRREWVDLEEGCVRPESEGVFELGPRAVEILRGILAGHSSEWVFPGPRGKGPLEPRNFCQRVFDPALERAGIADFTWRDLS